MENYGSYILNIFHLFHEIFKDEIASVDKCIKDHFFILISEECLVVGLNGSKWILLTEKQIQKQ